MKIELARKEYSDALAFRAATFDAACDAECVWDEDQTDANLAALRIADASLHVADARLSAAIASLKHAEALERHGS